MSAFFEVDLAGDDETGGDARVKGKASAYLILVMETDGSDDLMYILRCPDGTKVVVLVGLGDTEEGDDSIPDILFDEALISVNDLGDFAEDAGRDLLDLFGVELLGHRRVAREVGEEDGDVLALSLQGASRSGDCVGRERGGVRGGLRGVEGRRALLRQGLTASLAEFAVRRVRLSARGAGDF